jgi:DNA repair exonuclease SbcCD ATPase subunit
LREIILKSLTIENFKGIKERTIDFSQTTHIRGQNEKGKTTIFDAFLWLLFGKDSSGNGKFNFKPHETDRASSNYGQVIHNLSTSVTAYFFVDNTEITLKKVSEESWVKKNGQGEPVYQGNVMSCYCDSRKKKMKEFEVIVNGLVDEDKFRQLTDPMFFSRMHWEDQRRIIMDVVGDPGFDEVINHNPEKLNKLDEVTQGRSIGETKEELKLEIKDTKISLDQMPVRIEEAMHEVAEEESLDPEELNARKDRLQGEIEDLQEQQVEWAKANEKKRVYVDGLIARQEKIESAAATAKRDQREEIQSRIDDTKSIRDALTTSIRDKEAKIVSQREEIHTIEKSRGESSFYLEQKGKEHREILERLAVIEQEGIIEVEAISGMELHCPICDQVLPEDQAEEDREKRIRASQEMTKVKWDTVNERELALSEEIQRIQFALTEYGEQINGCKAVRGQCRKEIASDTALLAKAIDQLKDARDELANLEEPKEIGKAKVEINVLQSQIDELRKDLDSGEDVIKTDLQRKRLEMDSCSLQIARHEMYEGKRQRVFELHEENRQLKDTLDELKEHETLCDQFIIEKICMLGERVRETFGGVEFKLYDLLINGNISPTCEVLVKGVPWSDANNGHKIVTGIRVINILSEHYGIRVPIFIDNREAVNDHNVPAMKSQSIHLFVTEDPALVVQDAEGHPV